MEIKKAIDVRINRPKNFNELQNDIKKVKEKIDQFPPPPKVNKKKDKEFENEKPPAGVTDQSFKNSLNKSF